jgi:hypothetical protein
MIFKRLLFFFLVTAVLLLIILIISENLIMRVVLSLEVLIVLESEDLAVPDILCNDRGPQTTDEIASLKNRHTCG